MYTGQKPIDIGGWLLVVALGVCITPVRTLIAVSANDYYNLTTWQNLTTPTSPAYNIKLAVLIVVEVFYNMFFLAYTILLILLFFKKRSSFPMLMAIRYAGSIFFLGLETYCLYSMDLLDNNSNTETIKDLTQLIVGGAIWIPYLYLSERSKETFTNTLKMPEHIQETYKLKA
jgi:hypothetical protein